MDDTSKTLRRWVTFAACVLETRTYLAGLVEIPRIPVPETNVAHAA